MQREQFTLEIEGFHGPLGLLLDLIEQRKMQVSDVSLAQVSDDYIRYIEDRSQIPLSETAQFIVVASTLLLIKSRSLLPSIELTEDEESDIQELEDRLRLYAEVRTAARALKGVWGKQLLLPQRAQSKEVYFSPAADITLVHITTTAKHLCEALPTFAKKAVAHITKEIRIDDVIDSLTKRMRTAFKDSFRNVTSKAEKVETIVNFLALLELVKRGVLSAQQSSHFADITMEHDTIEEVPHYGQ